MHDQGHKYLKLCILKNDGPQSSVHPYVEHIAQITDYPSEEKSTNDSNSSTLFFTENPSFLYAQDSTTTVEDKIGEIASSQ